MRYRLGCDIGGTFTDFSILDTATGKVITHKRLTTPEAPSAAIEEGIRALCALAPGLLDAAIIVHGTTLVINAIIERKGARTALITTEGFRDVLEIGREGRFDQYDIWLRFPKPIVPRQLRLEVPERMHVTGKVLMPLTEQAAHAVVQELLAERVEAVAICLLHSYRNDSHERMLAETIDRAGGQLAVSLSSAVIQEAGEYERSCTTAINAYTRPLTDRYLADLEQRLSRLGFRNDLLITLSTGGVTSVATAREFPVRVMESGPAAGAIGAAYYARQLGLDTVVSFDMGGTTAKTALIKDGQISTTDSLEVDRTYRFKRAVLAAIGPSVPTLVLVLVITHLPQTIRVLRASALQVQQRAFVDSARISGVGSIQVMWTHILPNVRGMVIVQASVMVAHMLLVETILSFLGLGVQPPTPSLGFMVAEGRQWMELAPWVVVAPGATIVFAVASFTIAGHGLDRVLAAKS